MPNLDRAKWAERQVEALIEMGDDPLDAEKFVADALAMVPEGEDPGTWIPDAEALALSFTVAAADVADARADWYASEDVPNAWKRLLDATEVE